MSIGAGIFLMTAGAILAFGIRDDSGTVDLNVVGVVIMLGGAVGIWLSYAITNRRRRVETDAIDPVVEEEYRTVQNSLAEPDADRSTSPATVRHIDLDPAASDLHTPTADRAAPEHVPAASPDLDQPRRASWRKQLRGR
ncbi:DUF6458 family protein [Kribbella sp. NPDC050124]|uniref:DUF6458 family protein n=1 Tax=Kribbella sp. NPDC050124 TaxID=3364114 RepID=UPI0037A2A461